MARVLLVAMVCMVTGCSALVASSTPGATVDPTPSRFGTSTNNSASPSSSATLDPTLPPTPVSRPTPKSADEFEFIRWIGGYKILALEPGGEVWAEQDVHVEQTAGVLGRTAVDGVEWIRVQYGSDRPGDFVNLGWTPAEADIDRAGGIHIDPVYEYVTPQCPSGDPTLADVTTLVPVHDLYCFGSQTLTFAPLQVRNEGAEGSFFLQSTVPWLAEGDGQVAYWFPDRVEAGGLRVYVDPASDIEVPEHTWIEISGHFDDRAARECEITSNEPEFLDIESAAEAVAYCRGRFVVTKVRELTGAEIPVEQPRATPGPQPDSTAEFAVREFQGPFNSRIDPSSAWTGTEMVVWGGYPYVEFGVRDKAAAGGAAYSPTTGKWRPIPDGPLSARAGGLAVWNGSRMLLWGGYNGSRWMHDGALYDPASDSWTTMAKGPLDSGRGVAAAWTGTQWWVAVSDGGRIDVAAYEPESNSWRDLPSVDQPVNGLQLFWTGSEMLMLERDGALLSLSPDGGEWQRESVSMFGPAAWTGELLVGNREGQLGSGPFQSESWFYPVGWDPETRSEVDLPKPPNRVYGPIWTGRHLAFFDYQLALDLSAREWLQIRLENEPEHLERSGPASVWAGDRLIVWGGWSACPGPDVGYDVGYELISEFGGMLAC